MVKFDFEKLFGEFGGIRTGVLGDVMLDTYLWGHVERISPEAPVPVVALSGREHRIGGAGNVALNLSSLGAGVTILSVIGNDDEARILTELFESKNINTGYLVRDASRITTSKSRIIGRNQQMMRLDSEVTDDIGNEIAALLLNAVERFIATEKPHVLIFEDYNKGVLTSEVIDGAIALCRKHGVLTAVDPKRKHFLSYKEVDIFKPNLKEVKDGLNLIFDDVNIPSLDNIHDHLHAVLGHRISLITLSEKGIYFRDNDGGKIIPSHLRNIADVSGAGDTVIAVASLVYATTGDVELMAGVANIAGGLVCEEVGTVAINRNVLLSECKLLLGAGS